jgi:hypothetical protein
MREGKQVITSGGIGLTTRWTERRGRELIADFQLPIVDLIRTAASTQPLCFFL